MINPVFQNKIWVICRSLLFLGRSNKAISTTRHDVTLKSIVNGLSTADKPIQNLLFLE